MEIIWSDDLKTGIQSIDEQHQNIIEVLSGVRPSKLSKSELFQLLSDVQGFLQIHFDTEERYMIEASYPEYEAHKSVHDKAREDCSMILTQNNDDYCSSKIALALISYMQDWVFDHVPNEDAKLADYLKQHLGEIK
jgi:hemerythrin